MEIPQSEQAQVEDELDDGNSLVVDGVALSPDSLLSALRHAAQSLGLGRSGGKNTVSNKRI